MAHKFVRTLVVCKGNTCRSPMFEVLFREALTESGYDPNLVESAGVLREAAGKPANDKSIVCMDRLGFNLRGHRSRWAGDLDLSQFGLVVCMEPEVVDIIKAMKGVNLDVVTLAGGDSGIPNPYGKEQDEYDRCAVAIQKAVEGMFTIE